MKAKELARREREKRTDERKSGIVTVKNAVAFFPQFVRSFLLSFDPPLACLHVAFVKMEKREGLPSKEGPPTFSLVGEPGYSGLGMPRKRPGGKRDQVLSCKRGSERSEFFFI